MEVKTENLIDLAAEGTMASTRVRSKLRELELQRARLQEQLDGLTDGLSAGAAYLQGWLELLANPYELYRQASDAVRCKLNQAIFKRIYVCNDEVVGDELLAPVAELLAVQSALASGEASKHTLLQVARGELERHGAASIDLQLELAAALIGAMDVADVSSKALMVPLEGLEP